MINEQNDGPNLKRGILIIAGTLLGLFFLYLAFRDISWSDFRSGVSRLNPVYLVPAFFLMVLVQFIRAVRFGIILRPICKLRTKVLWDLLNLWAAASIIMPARLGELVRPYLLQQYDVPFSSSFGSVMVERFFDLSSLLLLLGIVLWTTPQVLAEYSILGLVLLFILAGGYCVVLLMLAKRAQATAVMNWLFSPLPGKIRDFLGSIIDRLLDGFGIMASFRQAAIVFTCSVLIWGLFSVMTYLFLLAFSIDAPFLVAVTIQVFICFGVALPSAPGFVGTFHAAGRYALALFGINPVVAVSLATVYHLFSILICLGLGIVSYFTGELSFDRKLFGGIPEKTEPVNSGGAA